MIRRAIWLLVLMAVGCGPKPPARTPPPRPDPGVQVLDGMLKRLEKQKAAGVRQGESLDVCLLWARRKTEDQCLVDPASTRTYKVRVALDKQYQKTWPEWEGRFFGTFECVNKIYQPTGVSFEVEAVMDWQPGAQRNDLGALLDRIHKELPAKPNLLRLGMVVWSKKRMQFSVGGEIGLAQGGACVVPSWPRVENDCITMAHELGHLVGARHVPGKDWIMAWKGHTYQLPVSDPLARVVRHHKLHPRNQEGIRVHHQAKSTKHGLHLERGCAERMDKVDACWRLTGLR